MNNKFDPENPPFDFSRARRFTEKEREVFRQAIQDKLGIKLPPRGRPPKKAHEKYRPITIRLHPKIIAWAKRESKRLNIRYQTIINDSLLRYAAWAVNNPNRPLI